ncbi:hypothetical protein FACS1894216_14790 [Synergistales bacterium]|nr:hypothetical protein FACS1894216_14790 [Synergistales bacterium]
MEAGHTQTGKGVFLTSNIFQKLRATFFAGKFLIFALCGGAGTLTNIFVSSAAAFRLDATLAYVCGYAVSLWVTYALNSRFVFPDKMSAVGFVKFVISYIPNFIVLFSFVAVFINLLGWYHILVYGLAAAFGLPLTFILVKIFAFAKKR